MPAVLSIDGTKELEIVMVTLDRPVTRDNEGKVYRSFREAKDNLLAQRCLSIPDVKEVYLMRTFIRVRKEHIGDWRIIVPALKRVINHHFEKEDQCKAQQHR
ncbi:NifU N-terminal domain-containing protein [Candidatus Sumerlaeota bacterium]|nr:NifU N-terminal domain-containing protein [Candidatus Sumerlaeota bacterium]